jgi:hypothetical protein
MTRHRNQPLSPAVDVGRIPLGAGLGVVSGALANTLPGVTDHGALTGLADDDHPEYYRVSGRKSGAYYYGAVGIGGTSGALATLNKLTATPFFVGVSQAFDRIAVANVTGVVNAIMRVGIYADAAGLPGALIHEAAAQIDLSTGTGIKEVTINQTLSGKVWLAAVPQVALPSALLRLGHIMLPEVGTASPYNAFAGYAVSQTGVSGALPNPWGATVNWETAANTCPAVSLRKT